MDFSLRMLCGAVPEELDNEYRSGNFRVSTLSSTDRSLQRRATKYPSRNQMYLDCKGACNEP